MRLLTILLGAVTFTTGAAAQWVSLHIETPAGKTQFRVGETVSVTLDFEPSPDGDAPSSTPPEYVLTLNGHDRSVRGIMDDRFAVTPEAGTRDPWAYRLHESMVLSEIFGFQRGDKPFIQDVDLNQWVRFERPGHYSVYAVFHAGNPLQLGVELQSNQIGIDIVDADPRWQEQELANDVAILNSTVSKHDNASFYPRTSAAHRITYLDTPAAVREMVHWLGIADIQTAQVLQDGLRSSQHGPEAIAAMKELLRSPSEPVSPIFLRTLAGLDKSGNEPERALAEVVEQKQGDAKAISLKTLLDKTPAESVTPKLRSEIASLFFGLPVPQQTELLNSEWKKIESADMILVLRQIYETDPQSRYPENPLLASAVKRLYELDTNRTRALLMEEMKRPVPRLPYETLAMLPDTTLPELDSSLLDNLRQNQNGSYAAAELIARYASASIADPVKDLLAKRDAGMLSRNPDVAAPGCAPPLIAYFLRVDPGRGERILREVLAERSHRLNQCWRTILSQTAPYNSGPVWQKVATDALKDPEVPAKIDAVRSLAQYGSPDSKAAIFDAFRFWHEWWQNRGDQNEENRRLEQAFIQATMRPRNWTPADSDLAAVRDLCLTPGCKSQVPQHHN